MSRPRATRAHAHGGPRGFPTAGRYIHGDDVSKFVPRAGHAPPTPEWKTYDVINDALPEHDPARADRPVAGRLPTGIRGTIHPMGTLFFVLLVVVGIVLLFALIELILWLAVIAIVAIAALVAWRRWGRSSADHAST